MLSTGRHNPGNRTLGAGAQRPKKAKRAILAKAPRVDLPASPTRTKKARKAIANLTPIARAPSEPTSKKQAKTRRARLDIHAEDARLSPPSSAHADHGSAVAHNVIVSAAPSPIATDQANQGSEPIQLLPDLIATLREVTRRRQDAVLAEGNLTRQMKRIVSRILGKPKVTTAEVNEFEGSGALQPLITAREAPREWRHKEEKLMTHLVEQLPVYAAFWEPIHGLGPLGLALIIGEAGDLSNYANPAKLWRRFGLHVINGKACATWRSSGGFTAKDWEAAGYSPRRRSMMFTITDSLLKKQNAYKALCDERKTVEKAKAEAEGLIVAPAADIPKGEHTKYRSLGHIKARAERYVAKRLLRDLWRAWRDQYSCDIQMADVPAPAESSQEAA